VCWSSTAVGPRDSLNIRHEKLQHQALVSDDQLRSTVDDVTTTPSTPSTTSPPRRVHRPARTRCQSTIKSGPGSSRSNSGPTTAARSLGRSGRADLGLPVPHHRAALRLPLPLAEHGSRRRRRARRGPATGDTQLQVLGSTSNGTLMDAAPEDFAGPRQADSVLDR
jgi:diamine N-acetyltransferase